MPQPGEGERAAIAEANVEGLPPTILPLPLVEAVGEDQAPAFSECSAEDGLGCHGLGTGVDQPVADAGILGPGRDETPVKEPELPASFWGGPEEGYGITLDKK